MRPRFRIRRAWWPTARPWLLTDRCFPHYLGRLKTHADAIAITERRLAA